MKLRTTYDKEANVAYIYLNESAKVIKTLEIDKDIMIDIDGDRKIVGIEVLHAKEKLDIPQLLASSAREAP